MSEAIQLDDYIDETRSDSYPSRAVARKSGGSGGDMDEVLKRLGAVESSVSELRVQVSGIAAKMPYLAANDSLNELKAVIPYLATKDDLKEVRGEVAAIAARIPHLATNDGLHELRAVIPYLATKADVKADVLMLKADLYAMETKIIKWMIGTALTAVGTAAGLAFSIAKFVH